MTARTHDLFALTTITGVISLGLVSSMTLGTAVIAFLVVFLGGLAPDLDESGSALWQRMPAGSGTLLGKIIAPVFGSHRFISHSLVGMAIFGFVVWKLLFWSSSFLSVDTQVVWDAFMLGMASHIFADSLTHEGVPIFFPLKYKVGIPPMAFLRPKTGGFAEKFVIFPGLVVFNAVLIYYKYTAFLVFLRGLV